MSSFRSPRSQIFPYYSSSKYSNFGTRWKEYLSSKFPRKRNLFPPWCQIPHHRVQKFHPGAPCIISQYRDITIGDFSSSVRVLRVTSHAPPWTRGVSLERISRNCIVDESVSRKAHEFLTHVSERASERARWLTIVVRVRPKNRFVARKKNTVRIMLARKSLMGDSRGGAQQHLELFQAVVCASESSSS